MGIPGCSHSPISTSSKEVAAAALPLEVVRAKFPLGEKFSENGTIEKLGDGGRLCRVGSGFGYGGTCWC